MSVAWSTRFILAAILAVGAACPSLAAPGKRIALVIGNSAYEHTSLLANPANDADDIAGTLSALGFEVTKRQDLKKHEMDSMLGTFAGSLKGAEIGLFYYAGHGLQVSGHNYLVPVDARLESSSALEFEAVRLDVIQRIMENETQTNVLILDACRDNPLTRNLARSMGTRSGAIGKGLAAQESGAGTIISYSTQPGNVALDGTGKRNSPFAEALVKHLPSEGRDLSSILVRVRNDVMAATAKRQVPWEHSALTDELVLARASAIAAPPPTAVEQSAETPAARKVEESAEESADVSGAEPETTTTAFQAFLNPEVPQVSKPHAVADESRNKSAGDAVSATTHQVKVLTNQLTYGLNGGVRFFVQNANAWSGQCTLQFAESAQPKMKQTVMQGGDYVEFKAAGATYRGTVVRVTNEDCTLEIAPVPAG
jgi:hypothetical protein